MSLDIRLIGDAYFNETYYINNKEILEIFAYTAFNI